MSDPHDELAAWLDQHGVPDKDKTTSGSQTTPSRSSPRALRPQAVLDLHGATREEALDRLYRFFEDSAAAGLRKVLVIHGKGHHSQKGAVLKETVRRFIEQSPRAGAWGEAERRDGGKGAVWVMVRAARL